MDIVILEETWSCSGVMAIRGKHKIISEGKGFALIPTSILFARTLKANKSVLAKHSKYFQGIVTFGEGEVSFDPKIVAFDVLDKLVKYMETGTLKPTMDDAEQLFYAADYLQIEGAMGALVEFLHSEASRQMKDLENTPKEYILLYLRIYSQFRRYETNNKHVEHAMLDIGNMIKGNRAPSNVIRPVCIKFLIAVHFKKVINELPILEMEEDHLFELLSSDDLRISEEDVLRTIKMWCFYNLEARRESFPKMVRCLRVDKSMTVSCGGRSGLCIFLNPIDPLF